MRSHLVAAFARKLGTGLRSATEQERAVLASVGVPNSLSLIVCDQWFDSYADIGGVEIFDLASTCEEVVGTFTKNLPAGGFLPIGKAGNGDILVIDFLDADFPVGYICLDQWPAREIPTKQSFVVVADSLTAFLGRGVRRSTIKELFSGRPRFPRDSYDAREENAEMGRHN